MVGSEFEYEDLPISSIEILPYHGNGFIYHWALNDSFSAPSPYTFTVQMAPTPNGPWSNISDRLVDSYWWVDMRKPVGKPDSRNYRILLEDHTGRQYVSEAVLPCTELPLSEFLLAREILRKEELNSRKFSAIKGEAWITAEFGAKCPACVDPITGTVRNSHCKKCHGTGFYPAYYGPFDMWLQFTPKQNHGATHDSVGGTKDDNNFSVRAVGTPRLKKNDVIRDKSTGKMYYIQNVSNDAEIRRIPIVQQLTVSEAISTDQCYSIINEPTVEVVNA